MNNSPASKGPQDTRLATRLRQMADDIRQLQNERFHVGKWRLRQDSAGRLIAKNNFLNNVTILAPREDPGGGGGGGGGVLSTVGHGLPTTVGRHIGDLHFNLDTDKGYTLINGYTAAGGVTDSFESATPGAYPNRIQGRGTEGGDQVWWTADDQALIENIAVGRAAWVIGPNFQGGSGHMGLDLGPLWVQSIDARWTQILRGETRHGSTFGMGSHHITDPSTGEIDASRKVRFTWLLLDQTVVEVDVIDSDGNVIGKKGQVLAPDQHSALFHLPPMDHSHDGDGDPDGMLVLPMRIAAWPGGRVRIWINDLLVFSALVTAPDVVDDGTNYWWSHDWPFGQNHYDNISLTTWADQPVWEQDYPDDTTSDGIDPDNPPPPPPVISPWAFNYDTATAISGTFGTIDTSGTMVRAASGTVVDNSMEVFVNGLAQTPGDGFYYDSGTNDITVNNLVDGDEVYFRYMVMA